MAESEPSRLLDISRYVGDDDQQYVEVGSNMYLGTEDGIKYSLMDASDCNLRLVDAVSESSGSLNSPNRSYSIPITKEKDTEFCDGWIPSTTGPKIIKLVALKTEQSPCKGQGDEIGNSVISPTLPMSSLNETKNTEEKINYQDTSTVHDGSAQLTYTTLLPKQEKKEIGIQRYYPFPRSTDCSSFPTPVTIRGPRYMRSTTNIRTNPSALSPLTNVRMRTPRQRRSKRIYQYTPQILHSTPNSLSKLNFSSESLSSNSSGIQNTSSFNDTSESSIEYPRVPNNTPTSGEVDSTANQKMFSIQWVPSIAVGAENYVSLDPRETHNEKERKRRLRIKNACQTMRMLLPHVVDKIDNASVFEQAAYFLSFMRETAGSQHDIEFLEKNFIY